MTVTRSVADAAREWLREGRRVAAALLIEVEGSAPLQPGAQMLIAADGGIEGSITGGCVEAAVVAEARAVLGGEAPRVVGYGIADELGGAVGLTCGGTVHVLVHELSGEAARVEAEAREAISLGRPVAIATLLDGEGTGRKLAIVDGEIRGGFGGPELLDRSVARDAAGALAGGAGGVRRYGSDGAVIGAELRVHIQAFVAPPKTLIFGAIDFSVAVAQIASGLGQEVTIVDPRGAFLASDRFRRGARTLTAWPEEAYEQIELGPPDSVLVFTHDPKLDRAALVGALRTEVGYIGALGSRRTTADREARLRESGVPPADLSRIRAPCGLDIGAATPEEVAISVIAEIIAVRTGRAGEPLSFGSQSIHPR